MVSKTPSWPDWQGRREDAAFRMKVVAENPLAIERWTQGDAKRHHGDAALLLVAHEVDVLDLARRLAEEMVVRAREDLATRRDLVEARRIIGEEILARVNLERRLRRQLFLLWTAAGLNGILVLALAWALR